MILAGAGVTIGTFQQADATNANLSVSADNVSFKNMVSGPQVIEVVIRDQNISDTGEGKGVI